MHDRTGPLHSPRVRQNRGSPGKGRRSRSGTCSVILMSAWWTRSRGTGPRERSAVPPRAMEPMLDAHTETDGDVDAVGRACRRLVRLGRHAAGRVRTGGAGRSDSPSAPAEPPTAPASPTAEPDEEPARTDEFIQTIRSARKTGLVLIGLSVVGLAFALERLANLRKGVIVPWSRPTMRRSTPTALLWASDFLRSTAIERHSQG